MATITIKISEEEKKFLQEMAKLENRSVSDLVRSKTIESLEDEYDAKIADRLLLEVESGKEKTRPISKLIKELGL